MPEFCKNEIHIDRFNNKMYNMIVEKHRKERVIVLNEEYTVQNTAPTPSDDRISQQDRLIDKLTDELPVLRARMRVSQADLSRRIGISRQTYSLIETKKQKMTWVTFMALIALFSNNSKTKKVLADIGLMSDTLFQSVIE